MCKEQPTVLNYADAKKSNLFIIRKQYRHVIQHNECVSQINTPYLSS